MPNVINGTAGNDILSAGGAGDRINGLGGTIGFVQQGADVIAYATAGAGTWYMDIQNATLAPVQAAVVYV